MPAPRWIHTASGHLCLGVALAGIVLPVPSTPFLLAAAACYLRGSEKHHRWLMEHSVMGPMIRDVRAPEGPSTRTRAALCVAALASAGSIAWRTRAWDTPWLCALLGGSAALACLAAWTYGRRSARA
ncbi:MAG: YbaN family protein [Armatimonadota bacterium]